MQSYLFICVFSRGLSQKKYLAKVKKINRIIAILKRSSTAVRSQWRVPADFVSNVAVIDAASEIVAAVVTAIYLYSNLLNSDRERVKMRNTQFPIPLKRDCKLSSSAITYQVDFET